jgi:Rod binding domain-containing protein
VSLVISSPAVISSTAQRASASAQTEQSPEETKKILDAARQFEALLLAEILKASHQSGSGWLGSGEDQTASSALDMAEEQFALALSQQGGLGLEKMIVNGLTSPKSAASRLPETSSQVPGSTPSALRRCH